jgi:hypothetical protein
MRPLEMGIRVRMIRTLRGTLRVRSYYLLLEVGGLYMFIIVFHI